MALGEARDGARAAVAEVEKTDEALAAATAQYNEARNALRVLVDGKLRAGEETGKDYTGLEEAHRSRQELEFSRELAGFMLSSRYSPIKRAVDGDEEVQALAKARDEANKARREPTSEGVTVARTEAEAAAAALEEAAAAFDALLQTEEILAAKVDAAKEALNEKRRTLRTAMDESPEQEAYAAADQAYKAKVREVQASVEGAAEHVDQLAGYTEARVANETARREMQDRIRENYRSLERGEDEEVVAARAKVAEADAARRAAYEAGALGEKTATRKEADAAYGAKERELREADEAWQKANQEERELRDKMRALERQLREAKQAAEEAAKEAEAGEAKAAEAAEAAGTAE